jgi:hypothetical protein
MPSGGTRRTATPLNRVTGFEDSWASTLPFYRRSTGLPGFRRIHGTCPISFDPDQSAPTRLRAAADQRPHGSCPRPNRRDLPGFLYPTFGRKLSYGRLLSFGGRRTQRYFYFDFTFFIYFIPSGERALSVISYILKVSCIFIPISTQGTTTETVLLFQPYVFNGENV